MKKYPVTYKGETYEVRWEKRGLLDLLVIYKVNTKRKFFCRYEEVYSEYDVRRIFNYDAYKNYLNISRANYDPSKEYIYQAKLLFLLWEKTKKSINKRLELENKQKQALENWNGEVE